jgi:hypothetical protein
LKAGGLAKVAIPRGLAEQETKLLLVAALITACYPVRHADVFLSKILEGYQRNGEAPGAGLKLVPMVVEQQHPHDIR